MKTGELEKAVGLAKAETKTALETMYYALNPGQRKQIIKNANVKALFDLYGVNYSE